MIQLGERYLKIQVKLCDSYYYKGCSGCPLYGYDCLFIYGHSREYYDFLKRSMDDWIKKNNIKLRLK